MDNSSFGGRGGGKAGGNIYILPSILPTDVSLSLMPMTVPKRCVFCLMTVGVLNCAQKTLMPRMSSSMLADGLVRLYFRHFRPGLHLEPSPASTPLARSSILRSTLGIMVLGM